MAKSPVRVYEDFDPASDLISEEGCDTTLVYLPGFKKHQLKLQLTRSGILRLSGEYPIGNNKWNRFHKEFRIPSNCDTNEITAKFEGGILYVRQPKLITPAAATEQVQKDDEKPSPEASKPQLPQQEVTPPQTQPSQQQETQTRTESNGKETLTDVPKKGEDVPQKGMEKKDETSGEDEKTDQDETCSTDEEKKKEKGEMTEKPKQVARACGSRGYHDLMNSEKLKQLAVAVLMVLMLGFCIAYKFKLLARNDEQHILKHSHEL